MVQPKKETKKHLSFPAQLLQYVLEDLAKRKGTDQENKLDAFDLQCIQQAYKELSGNCDKSLK